MLRFIKPTAQPTSRAMDSGSVTVRTPDNSTVLVPVMAGNGNSPSECSRKISDSCPSGHELAKCRNAEGYMCRQCSAISFQPNENWLGDRCRLRRVCQKPHMRYKDHGSTTQDANCECVEGFHFENVDQRACVPNQKCDKGYGQGEYGVCIKCIDQSMYSDTSDRIHKCKPLTNCEKQSRCTITKSNGLMDNVCGPMVRDVKSCDDPQPPPKADTGDARFYIIAGGIVGSIFLVFCILVIIFIVRRNSLQRRKYAQKPLSQEQLEELKLKILKESERDNALCKKVLSKSQFVVEERIERQIWTLAQELYRSHPVQGKYELIVEKYKESQHKYAVNGYLQEWRSWRGETKEAVAELFRCLSQSKRDDIVYEICNTFRHDVGFDVDMEAQLEEEGACNKAKQNYMDDLVEVFCPCCLKDEVRAASPKCKVNLPEKKTEKGTEASGKLLEVTREPDVVEVFVSPGAQYRARPSPSAPVDERMQGAGVGGEGEEGEEDGEEARDRLGDEVVLTEAEMALALHRQYSQPVQATT